MEKEKHFNCREWSYDEEGNRGIICRCCNTFKTEDNYSKSRGTSLGIQYKCKSCAKIFKDSYSKSKRGVIQTIWDSQKLSCKTRKMENPTYTKEWLFEWCLGQELFHTLFDKWVESNYNRYEKPSVDRLNNFKTYSEDNIQLMTWGENEKLAREHYKKGLVTFNYVGVTQLTKEGEFIKEFLNSRQAERELGIAYQNIHHCCKGRRPFAGGFRWKFIEKEITNE